MVIVFRLNGFYVRWTDRGGKRGRDVLLSTHLIRTILNRISFAGYLSGKTCVLITHQIQYLTDVDHIVLMESVSALETYLRI